MKRPAVWIFPAFLIGLWLSPWVPEVRWWVGAVLLAALLPSLMVFNGRKWMISLLLAMLVLGVFRMQQADRLSGLWVPILKENPSAVSAEAMVTRSRQLSGYEARVHMTLRALSIDGRRVETRIPVIVYVRDYEGLLRPEMAGTIQLLDQIHLLHDLSGPQEEAYLKQWRHQGIQAVLRVPNDGMTTLRHAGRLQRWAELSRVRLESVMDGLLTEPKNQLMKSLFFGNQGYLESAIRDLFSRTGTAHIIAVSGLHVGILAVLVQSALWKTGWGRRTSRGATLILVWFYAAMAGFPLSILRAATMYSLYVTAFYLKRRYDAKNILLWSGMGFLLINPATMYTISFQLSYTAAGAIIFLYPLLKKENVLKDLPGREFLLVTVSAQLGTMPILAWHFGTFSTVSLVANLLIVPVIGFLMPMGIFMSLVGLFSWKLARLPALLVEGGAGYMITMAAFFDQLPYSQVSVNLHSMNWVILYYLLLASLGRWLQTRHCRNLDERTERKSENDGAWTETGMQEPGAGSH